MYRSGSKTCNCFIFSKLVDELLLTKLVRFSEDYSSFSHGSPSSQFHVSNKFGLVLLFDLRKISEKYKTSPGIFAFFKLYLLYRTIAVNHQMVEYYLFELEAHLIKAVLRFTDALTPENYAYVLGKSFEEVANEVCFAAPDHFSN